jgi:hypothetical protein
MTSLLFVAADTFVSRAIRFITRSRVSHVAIGGFALESMPVVIHADLGGVQVTPRARFLTKNALVAEYDILPPVNLSAALERLGERYDFAGLAGYLPVLFWRRLGRAIKNPLAAHNATVCSELVLALDDARAVPEWIDLDPETATPQDLLARCSQGASFRQVPGTIHEKKK